MPAYWSPEHIAIVQDLSLRIVEVAKKVGRTPAAVAMYARSHGIIRQFAGRIKVDHPPGYWADYHRRYVARRLKRGECSMCADKTFLKAKKCDRCKRIARTKDRARRLRRKIEDALSESPEVSG